MKLYWQLKGSGSLSKWGITYLVIDFKKWKYYPSNVWGIGYWRKKV